MSADPTAFDEGRLLEKLRATEALFAGAPTQGERNAAGEARGGIQLRLKAMEEADPTPWPEFQKLSNVLGQHFNEVTNRIIAAAIHRDVSDAAETSLAGEPSAGTEREPPS